jgi:hypothetical protein
MAYSTMRSAIPLGSVSGGTFTAKLQNACTSTQYPEGTVFDCSGFTSVSVPSQFITGTITITRPGITLLFSEGDFIWNPTGGTALDANMFEIIAPNVTIIGVSRSAKDSVSTNGATRFVMNSPSTGYHVYTRPDLTTFASADSLTIMNCDFVGVKSIYTSSGGNVNYSTTGAGGILLTEGNVNQPNSNLNNVMISEVLVSGAKQHGVMIYGGMASKLQNVRVRNAAGHGFYIAGSTTSTTLDACYASGNYLAGFCINNTTYSTLTSCASDSNGLGYWMRNANSVTLNSCGAEACEVRSSIPNNLGIAVKNSVGTVLINDIGSDNVNFIKGTSFLFTGGDNITGTSCYSKDPGNRAGLSTFLSKYTAHIHGVDGTTKVNMDNFKAAGTSTTKYLYRLEDVNNFHIDDLVTQYDPTNPTESPDGSMTFVNQILDQGANNIFGDFATSTSWLGRRVDIANSEDNLRVNQLYVPGRLSIPVEPAHPANPEAGSIYFNNTLNKLFMFSGSAWFDTCCATAPTPAPECVFPNGGATILTEMDFRASYFYAIGTKTYFVSNALGYNLTSNPEAPVLMVFDSSTEVLTPLLTRTDVFGIQSLVQFIPSTIGYSSVTNSLYIGFSWGNSNIGDTFSLADTYSKLIKYNLNTATIDATVTEYIGFDVNDATPEKIFGTGQLRYVVQGSALKQINFGYYGENVSTEKPLVIINRDLNTLDITSQVTGDDVRGGYQGQSGPFINNNMINNQILITDDRILTNTSLLEGDTDLTFGVLDLSDGLMSYVTYDTLASPFPDNVNYVRQTYSKSQTDPSIFLLSDSISGKIYEIDLNTLTVNDEWSIGLPAYGVYDYIVNSVRFLVFTAPVYNTQTGLYEWKLTTFNTSNSELTFSPYIIAYTSNINAWYYSATLQNGMVFDIENNNMYTASSMRIQKFCAPYAV